MSAIEYVRDPRFKVLGCGVKVNTQDSIWVTTLDQVVALINAHKPCTIVGHNLFFDGLILIERAGLDDKDIVWMDTLALSRALLITDRYSLERVANYLCLPQQKMMGVLPKFSGKDTLTPAENAELALYCLCDVEATWAIHQKLAGLLPPSEARLIDATVRMGIHARLDMDKDLLDTAIVEAEQHRTSLIAASGIDMATLSSNQKFAAWLKSQGLEPPIKVSIKTGKDATAFSKGDLAWIQFKETNPAFQAAFDAREAVKSTLPLTRAKTFRALAETGKLPIPLNYYGAHTGRFSSGGGIGIQNLPRGGILRRSLTAPPGEVLVVGDLGQIEVRVNAALSGEAYLLETFRQEQDVYVAFAQKHYGRVDITKAERQFAKACVLGMGFGMGWRRFANEVRKGMMGAPPLPITDKEAQAAVESYRAINGKISGLWSEINELVLPIITGADHDFRCPWRNGMELRRHAIRLPNGMLLQYKGLHESGDGHQYDTGKFQSKLWHGTLVENVVQALARIIMTDALLRVLDAGLHPVFTCHDEIVIAAPEDAADETASLLKSLMIQPVAWMSDLPLAAEVAWDRRYIK